MNPLINPAAPVAAATPPAIVPDAVPSLSPVGEQALNGLVEFNGGLNRLIRDWFPDLSRTDRALLTNCTLSVLLLASALLLYALCGRLRAHIMRVIVRAGVLLGTLVGAACIWVPGVLDWLQTPSGSRIGGSALTIFLSVVASALLWEGSNRFLMNYYVEQVGAKSQRLRTLLPLFRRVILVFLIVITSLTVMTELGINIAPLLAGAGIIGIAIGFGAQKLAQDFITGLFIVLEDALALGDIVTIGTDSGVVEDMTLRTVRLRDLDGVVHILPFSSVQTILNKSKGTAYAVVEVGVAYDTDIVLLETTIKQVMADLKHDTEWQELVTEEVELLGIERLEASAIVYRFRQACPASKQFGLKREILRRLIVAFALAKIDIPFPTITHLTRTPVAPATLGVTEASPAVTADQAVPPAAPAAP